MNYNQWKIYYSITLIIALLTLGFNACNNPPKDNDWVKYNLKGKVKSISDSTYTAVLRFGEIEKDRLLLYEPNLYFFGDSLSPDENKEIIFNSSGKAIEVNTYKYFDSAYKKINYSLYKYDENGRMIEVLKSFILPRTGGVDPITKIFKTTFKYNENGREIESYKKITDIEHVLYKTTSIYNKNGYLVEKNYFLKDTLNRKDKYKYDENGHKIEFAQYNSDGSLKELTRTTYNDNGKDETFFDESYNKISNVKYDKYAKVLEIKSNKLTIKYEYDNQGNLIQNLYYTNNNILKDKVSYQYKYDKKNNWVKKISFKKNKPENTTYRRIEYYD
jgi:hypothetical protein